MAHKVIMWPTLRLYLRSYAKVASQKVDAVVITCVCDTQLDPTFSAGMQLVRTENYELHVEKRLHDRLGVAVL